MQFPRVDVAHRGTRIGVPRGDLDIPQVHARIQHGGDERMAQHMGVSSGDPYTRSIGELPQAAGGGVAVHPGAAAVEQDRPTGPGGGGGRCAAPVGW
jgi:hypothetical protein